MTGRLPSSQVSLLYIDSLQVWISRNTERTKAGLKYIKLHFSLLLLYYADPRNEFAGPIIAPLRSCNITSFAKVLQRWRAVGNTV